MCSRSGTRRTSRRDAWPTLSGTSRLTWQKPIQRRRVFVTLDSLVVDAAKRVAQMGRGAHCAGTPGQPYAGRPVLPIKKQFNVERRRFSCHPRFSRRRPREMCSRSKTRSTLRRDARPSESVRRAKSPLKTAQVAPSGSQEAPKRLRRPQEVEKGRPGGPGEATQTLISIWCLKDCDVTACLC